MTLAECFSVHFTVAKTQAPEADTVILLHEMGTSRHDWDAMGKALVEAGFGVIAPDLRGCGESMQKTDGTMVTAATFDHLAVPLVHARAVLLEHPQVSADDGGGGAELV